MREGQRKRPHGAPMDPAKRAAIQSAFRKAPDLHGFCPKCKTRIRGTLKQLKGHHCGSAG
jgi:hypothetical protein